MYIYHIVPNGPIEIPSPISNQTTYRTEDPLSASASILMLSVDAKNGSFPHYDEPYLWWFEHQTIIDIKEIDPHFSPKTYIGIYTINNIEVHKNTSKIKVILRSTTDHQSRLRLNLDAQLVRARDYKLQTLQHNFITDIQSLYAGPNTFQFNLPSEYSNFESQEQHALYSGPDTSQIDEAIGRIIRALAALEESMCSYLNHKKSKSDIICPTKRPSLSSHIREMKTSAEENPNTNPEISAAIQALDTKIRNWRNTIAHSVIRYNQTPKTHKAMSADGTIQKIFNEHSFPTPGLMLRTETQGIILTIDNLTEFESEIIATYATIYAHAQLRINKTS